MTMDVWQAGLAESSLQTWRSEFDAAASIASSLSLTDFIPESLKVRHPDTGQLMPQATAATIAAALLTGNELSMGPMASLRSIDVVNGTPALRAIAMRALVLSAGHDMWVESATNTRVVVCGQRKGSEHIQRAEWDEQRARDLQLWDKPGWRKQRRNMLTARATAECARLTAPERLLGLPYSAEEVADGMDALPSANGAAPAADAPAATTAAPRARRKRTPAKALADPPEAAASVPPPVDEPPLDDPSGPVMISPGQLGALHSVFSELGTTDRDDKLAMLSGITGRDITSSNDLTSAEAGKAIDALQQLLRQAPHDSGSA